MTFNWLAGLLDEGDGDEDPGSQEDEGEEKDRLHHGNDDHCRRGEAENKETCHKNENE